MIGKGTKTALAVAAVALAACTGPTMTQQGNSSWVYLSGDSEVPPVSTMATANGRFVTLADGSFSGGFVTNNIEATAAHIHMGARDENGPVILPLVKTANGFDVPAGAKLTPEQMVAFKAGKLYVNVHSAEHKGGEIRTQILW